VTTGDSCWVVICLTLSGHVTDKLSDMGSSDSLLWDKGKLSAGSILSGLPGWYGILLVGLVGSLGDFCAEKERLLCRCGEVGPISKLGLLLGGVGSTLGTTCSFSAPTEKELLPSLASLIEVVVLETSISFSWPEGASLCLLLALLAGEGDLRFLLGDAVLAKGMWASCTCVSSLLMDVDLCRLGDTDRRGDCDFCCLATGDLLGETG